MTKLSKGMVRVLSFVMLVLSLAACGQGIASKPSASVDQPKTVNVELNSFYLRSDVSTVSAGKVTFKATNKDVVTHEMLVVKVSDDVTKTTSGKGALKQNNEAQVIKFASDLVYDGAISRLIEEKFNKLGEVPDIGGGTSGEVALDLTPGTYLLLCNLVAHFKSGMRTMLVVTQ